MFFRSSLAAAMVLSGVSGLAAADNEDGLTAVRLMAACPDAHYVQVQNGRITWTSETHDVRKNRRCLMRAYAEIQADPYPVNMGSSCHATKVTVRHSGKIVLSC